MLLVAALLIISLLVACSGDDDDGSGGDDDGGSTPAATEDTGDGAGDDDGGEAETLDVCALVTEKEAGAALGEEITLTEDEASPPVAACTYESENGVVTITVTTGTRAEVEETFNFGTEGWEVVDGVGEEAAWSGPPQEALEVLQGNYSVGVSVFSTGEQEMDYKELSIGLAESALDRLP
jgi:hypothetical protein